MQVSYNLLTDTSTQILSYFRTSKYTNEEVKECGRGVLTVLLYVDQKIKDICLIKLADLKKTYELINKYDYYNPNYELFLKQGLKMGGNPHLSDALLSGLKGLSRSCSRKTFDNTNEEDVKATVRLMPESLNCYTTDPIGRITNPFPIFIACINDNIPTSIVEFLLDNGAKQKFSQTALDHIEYMVPKERYKIVVALLEKKGSISI